MTCGCRLPPSNQRSRQSTEENSDRTANNETCRRVTHVAKGKRIPPFLLLYVADHPETGPQALRLARKMNDQGMPASVYAAQGKNHLTINSDLGKPGDGPTQAVFDFLDRSLKGETASGKNE